MSSTNIYNLALWLKQETKDREYLLKNLIPEESLIFLSGQPKRAKKTFFMMEMAVALATGRRIDGLDPTYTEGVPVLICEGEGSTPKLKERWNMILKGLDLDIKATENIYWLFRSGVKINNASHSKMLLEFVKEKGIKMLILDTLAAHADFNENHSQEIGPVVDMFNELKNIGCSILVVHHLTKPTKDFMKDIDEELRGSSALAGAYDVHLAIRQKSSKQGDTLDLIVRSKDDEDKEYKLDWSILRTAQRACMSMRRVDGNDAELDQILTAEMVPGEVYSKSHLAKIWDIEGAGLEYKISTMKKDGILISEGNGYKYKGRE